MGEYVLGLDLGGSTAQSAACAILARQLDAWKDLPSSRRILIWQRGPRMTGRANLYAECQRRGELLLARGYGGRHSGAAI